MGVLIDLDRTGNCVKFTGSTERVRLRARSYDNGGVAQLVRAAES